MGQPAKRLKCDSEFYIDRVRPIIKKHNLHQCQYIEFATKALEAWENDKDMIVNRLEDTIAKQREIIDDMMKTFNVVEIKGYKDF